VKDLHPARRFAVATGWRAGFAPDQFGTLLLPA